MSSSPLEDRLSPTPMEMHNECLAQALAMAARRGFLDCCQRLRLADAPWTVNSWIDALRMAREWEPDAVTAQVAAKQRLLNRLLASFELSWDSGRSRHVLRRRAHDVAELVFTVLSAYHEAVLPRCTTECGP